MQLSVAGRQHGMAYLIHYQSLWAGAARGLIHHRGSDGSLVATLIRRRSFRDGNNGTFYPHMTRNCN